MDTADRVKVAPSQAPGDYESPTLAILTSGKLLLIPESVYADFPGVKGFEVTREAGRIVLTPLPPEPVALEEIHRHIAAQGVTEPDVAAAVKWARGQS